jgi:uncharacterized protein YndB with AHSA1/START domain
VIETHLNAPRHRVYRALVDAESVAQWRFPRGMTCEVHEFDVRVGGSLRISLTYDDPERPGKSSGRTDTYHGHFTELVPDERVVEVDEFETDDPELQGQMTITIELSDVDDGTLLVAVHDGLPSGVSPADNEAGWREALERLAALVESRDEGARCGPAAR